jgi:hypothetical protein
MDDSTVTAAKQLLRQYLDNIYNDNPLLPGPELNALNSLVERVEWDLDGGRLAPVACTCCYCCTSTCRYPAPRPCPRLMPVLDGL